MAYANPAYFFQALNLSPLPPILRHGLVAVSFFGFISFFSTTALFAFLTTRLITWRKAKGGYNQSVLLIYNLVIADLQESIAFLLNAHWVAKNALESGTPACRAQGWFISVGQLASGLWILTIAIHTFAAVIMGYRLSRPWFGTLVVALWTFIYLLAIVGIASHPVDLYVRAGAWVGLPLILQTNVG